MSTLKDWQPVDQLEQPHLAWLKVTEFFGSFQSAVSALFSIYFIFYKCTCVWVLVVLFVCNCFLIAVWSSSVLVASWTLREPSIHRGEKSVCVCARACAPRQGHWGVIGLLGPAPSLDTTAETGLLNHPHISEQDGGPGTPQPPPCPTSPPQPWALSPPWRSYGS